MSEEGKDVTDYKKIAEEVAKINPGMKAEDIIKIVKENTPAPTIVDEAAIIAKATSAIEAKGYISKADYDAKITEMETKFKPVPVDKEAIVNEAVTKAEEKLRPAPPTPRPDAVIPVKDLNVAAADLILGRGIDPKYNKK
jgi:hypothetical protein